MRTISTSIRQLQQITLFKMETSIFWRFWWKMAQIIIQTIMEIVAAGGKKHKFW